MGVTVVLSYPIPDNKSCQQVLESLYKLMDILSAKKCGTFKVDCDTFVSGPHVAVQKVLQTFHDTERPYTTFALIDNGHHHLLADSIGFDILVQSYFNQIYPPQGEGKKSQKIESSGMRFELCEADFSIRIGQVLQEHSLRGITIEIEYAPCLVPASCWDIISQVALNFLPPNQIPPVPQVDLFQPVDTIKQYQQIFNTLRKQP